MPKAAHQIAVILVPTDPDHCLTEEAADGLLTELVRKGVVDERGRAAQEADCWIPGGFGRIRVDRPRRPVVYGNRQGGYRAQCPRCSASLAREIEVGLSNWRQGQGRGFSCQDCQEELSLEEVVFSPSAAPGRWALVFSRAEALQLKEEALEWLTEELQTPFKTVVSRG